MTTRTLAAFFNADRSEVLQTLRRVAHGLRLLKERRDAETRLKGDALLGDLFRLAKEHPTPENAPELGGSNLARRRDAVRASERAGPPQSTQMDKATR